MSAGKADLMLAVKHLAGLGFKTLADLLGNFLSITKLSIMIKALNRIGLTSLEVLLMSAGKADLMLAVKHLAGRFQNPCGPSGQLSVHH